MKLSRNTVATFGVNNKTTRILNTHTDIDFKNTTEKRFNKRYLR